MNRSTVLALFLCVMSSSSDAGDQQQGTTLSVAAVQMKSTRDLAANLVRIKQHLTTCAGRSVKVAVFPECAITGYFDDVARQTTSEELEAAERQVAEFCRELSIAAVIGTPYRTDDKLYNSAIVITSTGDILERYHKVQLAEAWPDPGDHLSVFELDGVACSIIICHDERYPELVRLPVLAGARVIFYLSHESGLKAEHKIAPYRAQIQARAVENGVFIVHANAPANEDLSGSHGHSRIIGPDGNLIGPEASIFGEDILTATLDMNEAGAGNARRSLSRGILRDWWQDGIDRVRMIREPIERRPVSSE